jgi:ferredoxin
MTALRLVLDRTLCSGFGACAEAAPHLFRLGPDGLAEQLGDPDDGAAAADAVAACPMGAIRLEEVA